MGWGGGIGVERRVQCGLESYCSKSEDFCLLGNADIEPLRVVAKKRRKNHTATTPCDFELMK